MKAAACSRARGRHPSSFAKLIASGSEDFASGLVLCSSNDAASLSSRHCRFRQSAVDCFKNFVVSFSFCRVVSNIYPFSDALPFLFHAPRNIFFTPSGHTGSVNSSVLSTTRSHGNSLSANLERNVLKASSGFGS